MCLRVHTRSLCTVVCVPQAQVLNLLLCRCFQLSYLEKHPEDGEEGPAGSGPQRNPSLLNHGFPLSVSALVSFRRAPFLGLLPGTKVWTFLPFTALNILTETSFVSNASPEEGSHVS